MDQIHMEQDIKNIKNEITQLNVRVKALEETLKEYLDRFSLIQHELTIMNQGKKIIKKQEEQFKKDIHFKGQQL